MSKMDWLCACFRKKQYTRIGDKEPEPEPAQYISASLESEYDIENFGIKSTFSSIYKKMSEWSIPKKQKVNLFTVNEEEHDFLMDAPGVSPSSVPSSQQCPAENYDDVVDEII